MDGGLVTARIHQGLICTPLDTHRYLVLPGLIGGSPRGVGDPDQQPHLHHGTVVLEVPRIPASPAGWPRPYRRPSGRRMGKGLPERVQWKGGGLWPPPAGGNAPAWPFPLRGGARGAPSSRDLGAGTGREREGDGRAGGRERERDEAGARRPRGTPPYGPPPAGWPVPATSGSGTGPTRPFAGVVGRRTAPAPPGRSLPRRRGARPWATCGRHPGAAEPSQTVSRSPRVPRSGSVDGAARGFGRRIAGWPALGLRRPGGSRQAAVGLPPAPPPSARGSGAPATGCAPSHTPPLSSQIGPRRPPGRRGVPSSSAGRGRSMGLRRGFPSGLASSGWPAGLHPAPGPRAGTDLPAPASCPRALGAAPDEDQRATRLAPQVGLGLAGCMTACRLPRPGFRHQCSKVRSSRKEDEEVKGDEPQVGV